MTGKLWNDIVKAYDEQFHLLEGARAEYTNMIDTIIERLAAHNQNTVDEAVAVTHSIVEGDAGRRTFRTSLKVEDIEWCAVVSRMAVPWADDHVLSGKFCLAIEFVPQSEYLPIDRISMKDVGKGIEGWDKGSSEERLTSMAGTERWVYHEYVDVTVDDPLAAIYSRYGKVLDLARSFATASKLRADLVIKGRSALNLALGHLISKPIDAESQSALPDVVGKSLPVWQSVLRYVQFNFNGLMNIWFYVNPNTRQLMYGHDNDKNGLLNVSQQFAAKLGIVQHKFCNLPTGVILDEAALNSLSEQAIADKIVDGCKIFYATILELKP